MVELRSQWGQWRQWRQIQNGHHHNYKKKHFESTWESIFSYKITLHTPDIIFGIPNITNISMFDSIFPFLYTISKGQYKTMSQREPRI